MFIVKITENNTMYSVLELHLYLFLFQLELFQLVLFLQHFQYFLQPVYQLIFSSTYNFHSPNTHQYHMIYHAHTHNYQDSKQILYHMHLYQLILCNHTCIYGHSNVVCCYKLLHLMYIHTYAIHTILCVSFYQFLILD